MSIQLTIMDANGGIRKTHGDETSAYIGFKDSYGEGDVIQIDLTTTDNYLVVELDGTLNPSLIYVPGKQWRYQVISETTGTAYHPNAFKGNLHYLAVRYAREDEIHAYGNLALNPHDQKEASGAYPHASANVETRNDTTFFARNAIDGILANEDHGSYPFQSWGINQDPNACLRIEFGRPIVADQLGVVLRGDYPHDSYWTEGTLTFSDGSKLVVNFDKVLSEQLIEIGGKVIEWVEFSHLIKANDDSPFPALTQLAVYGKRK